MLLKSYLDKHSISVAQFAEKIGVKSRATVQRYISLNKDTKRIPEPEIMEKISLATGGAVTANDFYGLNGHNKTKKVTKEK